MNWVCTLVRLFIIIPDAFSLNWSKGSKLYAREFLVGWIIIFSKYMFEVNFLFSTSYFLSHFPTPTQLPITPILPTNEVFSTKTLSPNFLLWNQQNYRCTKQNTHQMLLRLQQMCRWVVCITARIFLSLYISFNSELGDPLLYSKWFFLPGELTTTASALAVCGLILSRSL